MRRIVSFAEAVPAVYYTIANNWVAQNPVEAQAGNSLIAEKPHMTSHASQIMRRTQVCVRTTTVPKVKR
jgi:hypothetical protein